MNVNLIYENSFWGVMNVVFQIAKYLVRKIPTFGLNNLFQVYPSNSHSQITMNVWCGPIRKNWLDIIPGTVEIIDKIIPKFQRKNHFPIAWRSQFLLKIHCTSSKYSTNLKSLNMITMHTNWMPSNNLCHPYGIPEKSETVE